MTVPNTPPNPFSSVIASISAEYSGAQSAWIVERAVNVASVSNEQDGWTVFFVQPFPRRALRSFTFLRSASGTDWTSAVMSVTPLLDAEARCFALRILTGETNLNFGFTITETTY